jgi:hypothetical protein
LFGFAVQKYVGRRKYQFMVPRNVVQVAEGMSWGAGG